MLQTIASSITANNYDLRLSPLHFVYGGFVYSSTLNNAGSDGYSWSSKANDSTSAYYLNFLTGVYPSSLGSRYYGRSVRCVAR